MEKFWNFVRWLPIQRPWSAYLNQCNIGTDIWYTVHSIYTFPNTTVHHPSTDLTDDMHLRSIFSKDLRTRYNIRCMNVPTISRFLLFKVFIMISWRCRIYCSPAILYFYFIRSGNNGYVWEPGSVWKLYISDLNALYGLKFWWKILERNKRDTQPKRKKKRLKVLWCWGWI
jgi:hypothetical protein